MKEEAKIDQIKERMNLLPPEFKMAIENSKWEQAVIDIGKKNNFTIAQIGIFQNETQMVLLALSNPQDYSNSLKTKLGIDEVKTKELIAEANEKVFKKIKDLLISNTPKDEEENLQSSEKQILSSSGVELEGEEVEEYDPPKEKPIDRNKVLSGVENPTPSVSAHLVDDKMSQPFSIPTAKKEYSASNIPTPKPQTPPTPNTGKPVDPYRMPI
jgi:hypothetical protein